MTMESMFFLAVLICLVQFFINLAICFYLKVTDGTFLEVIVGLIIMFLINSGIGTLFESIYGSHEATLLIYAICGILVVAQFISKELFV